MIKVRTSEGQREIEAAVHGGNWRDASRLYGHTPDEILDFSVNINPLGTPESVMDCLHRNLGAIRRYPDPESQDLRLSLARYLGVEVENVMTGNGSAEILYLLLQTLGPRRVLVAEPTFSEYRRAAQINGADIKIMRLKPQDNFFIDPEVFIKNLAGVDMAFLCNPNNPTGNLIPADTLRELAEACCRKGVFLVVDESFLDFLPEWPELSLCRRAAEEDKLLVLRSLTKIFAVPGLRLGAAVAGHTTASLLQGARDPWNVNILAQMAGEAALKENAYLELTRTLVRQEKAYLAGRLAAFGLKPFPAAVNFILVDISAAGWTAPDLVRAAGRRGILIRDCSSFYGLGPDYIRLAVKDRAANNLLLEVFAEIFSV
ncbi:MAG: threonine-phosphate decarboxylase CobD [Eubacteriales bacterium]